MGNVAVERTRTDVAARAVDAVKVYGKGDAAVRALDGVTVGFPAGRFMAVMGPPGRASPPCCTAWLGWTR